MAATSGVEQAVVVLQPDTEELSCQLGGQAVRILGGASPQEVPVEDPANYRLVVNIDTADELGLDLPTSLIDQADRIIDD